MSDSIKNYIVYKIINKINDKIYIGCHVTENINDNYMGSGTNIKKAVKELGRVNFNKIVLYNFDNKEDMFEKEEQLVNREFIKRDDVYNIIVGGYQYLATDTVPVKDKEGNFFKININDPRYLSGELKHVCCGTLVTKDENGKCYRVSVDDPKYLSGELKNHWHDRKHSKETKLKMSESKRGKYMGVDSSQYGTCWITDGISNKKINKGDVIPHGWELGRYIKNKINYCDCGKIIDRRSKRCRQCNDINRRKNVK